MMFLLSNSTHKHKMICHIHTVVKNVKLSCVFCLFGMWWAVQEFVTRTYMCTNTLCSMYTQLMNVSVIRKKGSIYVSLGSLLNSNGHFMLKIVL